MITSKEELSIVIPADWVPGPPQGSWTYEDYAGLPDDGHRYEIVNGVLVMAPAPDLGRVFAGPVDVELGSKNVFQPDVVVILNAHLDRMTQKKIIGAPDLVVEMASPSTAAYDRLTKYDVYARAGVTEYWIVKPTTRTVEVLVLEDGEYRSLGIFHGQQTLPSRVVAGLTVRVEQFFV